VNGEYWSGGLEPDGVESLAAGENVEVVGVEGNHLTVRPFGSDTEIEEASDESTSDESTSDN
jgi:membrane-bound ClpP family serine protease